MCIWNSDKAWLVSTSQCPKSQLGDLNGWDDSKSLKLESSGDDFTQPVWFLGWDDTNSWGSLDIYLSSVCLSICLSIYLIIFIYSWDFFTWTFHTASIMAAQGCQGECPTEQGRICMCFMTSSEVT